MSLIASEKVITKVSKLVSTSWKRAKVAAQTVHVSGPKKIVLNETDVVLVCLMKNSEYYIRHLIDHHRAIGVQNFLFIDNGSTDDTLKMLANEPDVTVYANALPVKHYESLLRGKIARQVVKGGWFLFVDTDELIVFSRGEGRKLSDFARYCNSRNYDVAIGQVLDLFSLKPLSATSNWDYISSVEDFNQFSIDAISYYDYDDADNIEFHWHMRDNVITNEKIKFMFGGIRNEVFGESCCLTTHRFVRNVKHVELYSHPHCSNNATCADFTFLVKHYKFAGDFWKREIAQVEKSVWNHGEDKRRISKMENQKNFLISSNAQQKYQNTDDLLRKGFLVCSESFLEEFPPILV